MKIAQSMIPQPIVPIGTKVEGNSEASNLSFADFLKQALGEVNNLQIQSQHMKQALLVGEIENVHDVMIAAEKAGLALQLTVEVRNKIVEAYQEIMRMQL